METKTRVPIGETHAYWSAKAYFCEARWRQALLAFEIRERAAIDSDETGLPVEALDQRFSKVGVTELATPATVAAELASLRAIADSWKRLYDEAVENAIERREALKPTETEV